MRDKTPRLGSLVAQNPRRTITLVALMLTLLLFAVDPAAADVLELKELYEESVDHDL